MPTLSLRQAAAAYAVSRTTLTNDLKKGRVSGSRDELKQWQIDESELARVYSPRPAQKTARPAQLGRASPAQSAPVTSSDLDLAIRLARLEAELTAERDKTALLERNLNDLRRMLPAPDAKPRRWWSW